ncbi:MAG: Gfo/Idh/MocA family oxidoreductase, partial [Pseudolabrys sp.]
MTVKEIGIILHGATGRIGATQHLANALAPIRAEGGLVSGANRIMPRLLLAGRNATRLEEIARLHGGLEWTTDVDAALAKPAYSIFFDAAATEQRVAALTKAIAAGKHIYSEKPAAPTVVEGLALLHAARARGLKTGVVEDKIYLPGLQKLRTLSADGFFGRVTGFRLEFGWWVFDGIERASQRPSWNYKRATGGGLTLDMYPHWRYVLEGILAPIRRVVTAASTAIPERRDETGVPYRVDVEDASLTLAELANGVIGSIICSWATRVRRDDLLTLQIDGTDGSAIAGLHRCWIQTAAETPLVRHFNP